MKIISNAILMSMIFLANIPAGNIFIQGLSAQSHNDKLLFKSGFEKKVYIGDEERPAHYFIDIKGSDGMDWEKDLEEGIPFVDKFWLNFVHASIPEEALAEIISDPVNQNNKVLYFENRKDAGKDVTSRTQNELVFNRKGETFSKGFIRYKFFLHDNIQYLRHYPEKITWFTITEWWEHHDPSLDGNMAGKSRVKLSINKNAAEGNELFWHLEAQKTQPSSEAFNTIWAKYNKTLPVITGKWFIMEQFFKPGDDKTGKVWIAIVTSDGKRHVLFDVNDYTQHPDNPQAYRAWQCFKLYTSAEIIDYMRNAGKPVAGYYDDFEFWSGFPPDVKQ